MERGSPGRDGLFPQAAGGGKLRYQDRRISTTSAGDGAERDGREVSVDKGHKFIANDNLRVFRLTGRLAAGTNGMALA
jgi:hypothetical protein